MIRLFLTLLMTGSAVWAADDYVQSIERWREERQAALTEPESWLSLIGLHAVAPGSHTIGSGTDNAIRLAAGPARLGVLTLAPDRGVTLELAEGVEATMGGEPLRRGPLVYDEKDPTLVRFGAVSFIVIERGGGLYLRVRDRAAVRRRDFAGIDYFPINPAWRIEARWVPFDPIPEVPVTNILGQTSPMPAPGKAVFVHEGRTVELVAVDEGADELFFILTDLTAGVETYGAARFLYTEKPKDGRILLDFNRTENPPCAFNPYSTCPLPLKENRLAFRLDAGEKDYRGVH